MNVSNQKEPVAGFFRRITMFLLARCTSTHAKRILFLTSLYCRINHLDRMRDEVIDQLNGLLDLAHRRDAIRLPTTVVKGMEWNMGPMDAQIQEQLNRDVFDPTNAMALSEVLVTSAPSHFHYDEPSTMVQDVFKMLRHVHDRQHQELALAA